MPRKSIWAQLCAVLLLAEARSTPEGTLKERLGRLIILARKNILTKIQINFKLIFVLSLFERSASKKTRPRARKSNNCAIPSTILCRARRLWNSELSDKTAKTDSTCLKFNETASSF